MEVALELRQVGPLTRRRQARRQCRLEVERSGDRLEVLAALPVDVDPEEAPFAQILRQVARQVDVPVRAVGVVQPGAERNVGRGGQRSDPSSTAPAIARTANPY